MRLKQVLLCSWMTVLSLLLLARPSFSQQGGTGYLEVLIEGGGDGGRWRVDGGPWKRSQETQTVALGRHTVDFIDTEGWTKPAPQTVNVDTSNRVYVVTGRYISANGFVQVDIQPASLQARWIYNGLLIRSGEIRGNIPPGSLTIHFENVLGGWTKPAPQTVNVVAGQTTRVTGTYAPPGSIQVAIHPDNIGAWRLSDVRSDHEGYYWKQSNREVGFLPAGNHTVEFNNVDDWIKPATQTVNVVAGQTTRVSGTYTPAFGSLQVAIQPAEAANLGARWQVDRGPWLLDDYVKNRLPPGSHTVDFKDIPGWAEPAPRTVQIIAGQTARIAGAYTQIPGSLRVTISPERAAAQAQWRVVSSVGAWKTSNQVVENLTPGSHAVEFSNLPGWTKPANQTIHVSPGQTAQLAVDYRQSVGSLVVTIQPQEALARGARWRMDGGPWIASGSVQSGVSVGQKNIEFQEIPGWIKPTGQTVNIIGGQTTQSSGEYRQATGSLVVTIQPAGAVQAGAQWRVDGGAWQNSGAALPRVPAGSRNVEFKEIPGWAGPAAENVVVNTGQAASLTKMYSQQPGSLQVTIIGSGGGFAGMWQVDNTGWKGSNAILNNITPGPKRIEFNEVPGWIKPRPMDVTVISGQLQRATATYTRSTGLLRVIIQPGNVEAAGAQWRIDGGPWQPSRQLLSNIEVGTHQVEYSDVAGWIKPPPASVNILGGQSNQIIGTYKKQ